MGWEFAKRISFPSLRHVYKSVRVEHVASIQEISFPALETIGAELSLRSLRESNTLTFPALTNVGEHIRILNNGCITDEEVLSVFANVSSPEITVVGNGDGIGDWCE